MENQYKMRRMGGRVDRAEEVDSSNNFSVNQARTMNNYGMAQNSGLPYVDSPNNFIGGALAAAVKTGAKKVKDWASKYDWSLKSRSQGGRSLVAPSSKGGKLGFAGDVKPYSKRNNEDSAS